jgi:hypothetical protein
VQIEALPQDFNDLFASELSQSVTRVAISREVLDTASGLAEQKYRTIEWLKRR